LEPEEKHESQHEKAQQRANIAITAGIPGFKVRIMNFRQRTPFSLREDDPENRGKKSACMAS
jgi:hypothetical protein